MNPIPDFDVIVIAGAPGSGKTTVGQHLRAAQGWPLIELGRLRQFHLDPAWTLASAAEEQMAFENLLALLRNYRRHGYRNVLVNDLEDFRVQHIPTALEGYRYVIISLVVDDEELARRVLDPARDSGFRDVQTAIAWNQRLRHRPLLPNEHRLDSSHQQPQETVESVLGVLSR